MREKAKRVIVGEWKDNNNKSLAQKKKRKRKSGPELECYERIERLRFGLMWEG